MSHSKQRSGPVVGKCIAVYTLTCFILGLWQVPILSIRPLVVSAQSVDVTMFLVTKEVMPTNTGYQHTNTIVHELLSDVAYSLQGRLSYKIKN